MACDTRENKKKQRGEKSVSKGGRQKWEHEKRKEEEEEEKKKKSRGEIKKKKVTTGVNLRSRFALNFDFTIVVLAISPLAKSSLKGFRSFFFLSLLLLFFSSLQSTLPRLHFADVTLVASSPSRTTLSPFRYVHKPIPSYADSFSLAHFFFPLLFPRFFFIFCLPIFCPVSFLAHPTCPREDISPSSLDCSTAFSLLLFANTIYHRIFLFIGTIYFYLQPDRRRFFVRKSSLDIIYGQKLIQNYS